MGGEKIKGKRQRKRLFRRRISRRWTVKATNAEKRGRECSETREGMEDREGRTRNPDPKGVNNNDGSGTSENNNNNK